MMMGRMMTGGAPKAMPVSQDLQDAIVEAKANGTRAIKFTVDAKRPRLVFDSVVEGGPSFAEDFEKLNLESLFQDATACAVLLRVADEAGTIPGAKDGVFVYCGWMPSGVPVKSKMAWSSALSSLKEGMPGMEFREFNMSERSEANLAEITNVGKDLTDEEKYAMMTDQEREEHRIKEESARLQEEYDNQLRPKETFGAALGGLFAGGAGMGFFAPLSGDNCAELLGGEAVAAADGQELQMAVPQDQVGWGVVRSDEKTIQVFQHLPAGAPDDLKTKAANFKIQVVDLFKAQVPPNGFDLEQLEFDESGGYKVIS